jgi:endonuclease YncB( thermonuclease family)
MFLRTPWLAPLLILLLGTAGYASLHALQPMSVTSGSTGVPMSEVTSETANLERIAAGNDFLLIRGAFTIIGKSPDGDSVRFIPDDATLLKKLKNAYRIKPSSDGSVQLRFEAIDTPELHFGNQAQPLGAEARDALLKLMGFSNVTYKGSGEVVASSNPERVRGAILSQAAESNGRPISYVLLEKDAGKTADGSRMGLSTALLKRTFNDAMTRNGLAYYTVYTSTPEAQRAYFKAVALEARGKKLGVWAVDKTTQFTLKDQTSINETGQLVLPKIFRRCTTYLQDVAKGKFSGNLQQWLVNSQTVGIPEDDEVQVADRITRLSGLIAVKGTAVTFNADPLEIVFLEK